MKLALLPAVTVASKTKRCPAYTVCDPAGNVRRTVGVVSAVPVIVTVVATVVVLPALSRAIT